MDYSDTLWTQQWVKQWVEQFFWSNIENLFKGLGAESGKQEKELREHIKYETGLLLNLIELNRQNAEKAIEKQAKVIESQAREIASLKAKLATRRKDPEIVEQYRPTNGQPRRLM
jgi:hypothetical protein